VNRSESTAWETRFDWTLTALMLGAFGLAIFQSGVRGSNNALLAALIAGAYIVVVQVTPRRVRNRGLTGELIATSGVVATLAAVMLTGGENNGYILLVAVPIYFAAAFIGFRIGMETALLATAGLFAIMMGLKLEVEDSVTTFVFYLLIGFTFSQARRLLVIERARSDALRAASALDAVRLERLESAHDLLVELSEVAGTNELSAVSVGETALRELADRVPIEYGSVSSASDGGVVAEWGEIDASGVAEEFPIAIGDRTLGTMRLWHRPGVDLAQHHMAIEAVNAGVALAFDNIQLLQTVARRSVQDERNRVARELHDDIGPALASLGLGLDVLIQGAEGGSTARHLERLRASTTELVERVRTTVAALRRADTTTVLDHIHRIAVELGAGPPNLIVAVEERAPSDGETASEVGAILVEAVRNAARHASAETIRIDGVIAGESGRLIVSDDGKGFDAGAAYPGHFGLVGMRERAAAIGGDIEISSMPGRGTTLHVVWGTPQVVNR
jgi:signal transduction histidine kinase